MLKISVVVAVSISSQLSIATEGTTKDKPSRKKVQNSYIVDPADPFLPVKINSYSKEERRMVIRDLGETDEAEVMEHPGRIPGGKPTKKSKIQENPQQVPTYVPARINLGEIAFEGRVIEPRIKFAPSQLEQQQSHDVAKDPYFSKIYSILEKSDF